MTWGRSLWCRAGSVWKPTLACAMVSVALGCATRADVQTPDREYLYVWTGSADTSAADFLAVLDVTEDSARYGRLVTTMAVPGVRNMPHHTEHEMPADGQLFANGFASGQTFVLDVADQLEPRLAAQFGDVEGYSHPHSFARLPSGNVLATFQMRHGAGGIASGGLVELTPDGKSVRSSSSVGPGLDAGSRVYSAAIVRALDRIVTTTTDMDPTSSASSNQLQVWRLSDLALLHTITLPAGPLGDEAYYTAEPRVLADGRTVLVSTFNCGLYLLDGLDGSAPTGELVSTFPRMKDEYCAIPVVVGNFYLVTVPALNAVVSLDVSDPAQPREVSRLVLGSGDVPHWIAVSPDHRRVVITGYGAMDSRVVIARFDAATGALALDERFREEGSTTPGFMMRGKTWPHGGTAAGNPHGAVFGLR